MDVFIELVRDAIFATPLVIVIVYYLLRKKVDSLFNEKLEKFKFKFEVMFHKINKLSEKEFELIPVLWRKLHKSLKCTSSTISPLQSYPDLNKMEDAELREFVEGLKFSDFNKKKIFDSDDKLKTYVEVLNHHRIFEVKKSYNDFYDYYIENKIFISDDLKAKFEKIDSILRESIVDYDIGNEDGDRNLKSQAYKRIKDEVGKVMIEIEALVQKRLAKIDYYDA